MPRSSTPVVVLPVAHPHSRASIRRLALSALATVSMVVALGSVTSVPARADTAPLPPVTIPTVSADALPTAQINGVVWDQTIVGNTVYVVGSFTSARPAGSAAGTNETPRSNILAYDLTTGALSSTWVPSLNAEGKQIRASADGSVLFVSGSFTQVSGVARNRLVALNAVTGAVVANWNPKANASTGPLAVSGTTLYVGGIFTTMGGLARTRLAAVSTTTGAVLPWAPTADAEVKSLTVPPDSGKVIVGGRFANLNGAPWYGLGALDAVTGANLPWAMTSVVKNAGKNSAITSLTSDASHVYGSGYTFGSGGNFEGTFSANVSDGSLVFVTGCKGDTYDAFPIGSVLYFVGHTHDCSTVNGLPQTSPSTYQRAQAETTGAAPSGLLNGGGNFNGLPAPELLHWLPTLTNGSYTGQDQAAWDVAASGNYVVLGGEFPTVNGIEQQGLVRFAISSAAPNLEGPLGGAAALTPTATNVAPGTVRISWPASWDRDNRALTYQVLRGPSLAAAVPVATITRDSNWWNRPVLAFFDDTSPPGSTQGYRIRVSDAFGNTVTSNPITATIPAGALSTSTYADQVRADGASGYWRLDEAGGVGNDWVGGNDLTIASSTTRGVGGALVNDTDQALTFAGSATVPAVAPTQLPGPQVFTEEAWFRTTSIRGGKIIGFGSSSTAASTSYDRQVYLTNNGRLVFGVSTSAVQTLTTTASYNDGQWHHVAATLGSDGMQLYVDGALAASNAAVTSAQVYRGYWRIGGDAISSAWPNKPTSTALAGSIDDVAVYPVALSQSAIQTHRQLGLGVGVNRRPAASFSSSASFLAGSFDASGSSDPEGPIASYAWDFGDGTSGTGVTATHTYPAAGTYPVQLTVTDSGGATAYATSSISVVAPANQLPSATFSSSVTGLSAALDASGSSDPDGSIASYAWDFGDGTSGTGVSPVHAYGADGTYQVTLTVTDNAGGTGATTKPVTVATAGSGSTLAADSFTRTVTGGWGTADAGGPWSLAATGSTVSATGDNGQVSVPAGKTVTARLNLVQNQDNDLLTEVWSDTAPSGGGIYASSVVRSTSGGDYRVVVKLLASGAVTGSIASVVGATQTALTSTVTIPGITYTPGTKLWIRAQASGAAPTTVRYRVWLDGTSEPSTWQQSVTDGSAALQAAGAVGLITYVSGSSTATGVVHYDNLTATRL